MDFGQKIFEGTPNEVASSDIVRAAYLGSEEVEVALEPSVVGEPADVVVPSGSAINGREDRS